MSNFLQGALATVVFLGCFIIAVALLWSYAALLLKVDEIHERVCPEAEENKPDKTHEIKPDPS